jgi:uncharacterized protein YdaU (DUF1376 family)
MSKDPAFLFYPGDWLGGTLGMTFEEKGAYMELLMMQFNRGHMTSHMIGQVVGQLWVTLEVKFVQDEKGRWYNARLEEEQNKRKTFVDSRKNNISGLNQYTKKTGHMKGHTTSHMENEDVNENKDKSSIVIFSPEKLKSELKAQESKKEKACILYKIELTEVDRYIETFVDELDLKNELQNSFQDHQRHFGNWLKIQMNGHGTKRDTKLNSRQERFIGKQDYEGFKGF